MAQCPLNEFHGAPGGPSYKHTRCPETFGLHQFMKQKRKTFNLSTTEEDEEEEF